MTGAQIPRSVDVWVCPDCGHRSLTIGGRGHLTGCSRWPAGLGVVNRYVLAEPTDEMVERLRESLWSTWGAGRKTTDWPSRDQLRAALERALSTTRNGEEA